MASDFIIPVIFLLIILLGYSSKIDIYGSFTEGAKDGINTVFGILPTLIGLMLAVAVFRASGAMDILLGLISPLIEITGFPREAVPLGAMKLVSSSGATGILIDIFKNNGPDSFVGRVASVMMSCTETVFYTMSVYFMSVGIKKTRYTINGAIFSNLIGMILSFYLILLFFGK